MDSQIKPQVLFTREEISATVKRLPDEPLEVVVRKVEKLERLASDLGTTLSSPFSTLSFLALPVIPELRLTYLGLVDVNQFKLIK